METHSLWLLLFLDLCVKHVFYIPVILPNVAIFILLHSPPAFKEIFHDSYHSWGIVITIKNESCILSEFYPSLLWHLRIFITFHDILKAYGLFGNEFWVYCGQVCLSPVSHLHRNFANVTSLVSIHLGTWLKVSWVDVVYLNLTSTSQMHRKPNTVSDY